MTSTTIVHSQLTVGTTATQVRARRQRDAIVVQNVHATNNLFVGGDNTVTDVNGLRIPPAGSVTLEHAGDVWVYGSAAGTDVRILELS